MKFKIKADQSIFFFSDPHYGHKNITAGETTWPEEKRDKCRAFATVHDMNNIIVENINDLVGSDDILICLGDWSFGKGKAAEFRSRLNCKNIYLVPGNHDDEILENKDNERKLFTKILETDQDKLLTIQYMDEKGNCFPKIRIFVNHYPVASWRDMKHGVIHLYGHVHASAENRMISPGKMLEIGMEGNDMKPYNLLDITPMMVDRANRGLMMRGGIPVDHHEQINDVK